MRKVVGILGLLSLTGGLVGGAIAWQQATSLPTWYTENKVAPPTVDRATQSARRVEQKLKTLQNPQTTVTLSSQEISDMVTAVIGEASRQSQVPEAIRGVNAQLEDGKVKAGAVIDFGQLTTSEQPTAKQQAVINTLKRLPGVGDRPLYIGIESVPTVRNGRFELDPQTKVQLGNLSLSLDEAAKYTGVPPQRLQAEINRAIPIAMSGVALKDVNIQDQNLVLRSGVRQR
jgi:hypothetical protein